MTASSPPTRRVVDIIELLAERRGSTTRLSDIVHALGLNQATAYVILKELDEMGWVTRNPADKTFSVGAALVRLAGRIDQAPSIAHAARAAASAAATDTGYAASVSERVGDSLVITAFIAGRDDPWSLSAGDRVPFAAPFGPAFAAWDPADERRVWIERSGVNNPAFEERLEEHLEETRRQGFSVERMSPDMVSAIPVMTRLQMDAQSDSVRDHLNEVLLEITGAPRASGKLGSRQRQYVGAITAPIFNQLGRVTHNICVHPFTALSLRNVDQIGRHLRKAAGAIGTQAG
ncbi:helix-turn-helix domain-containing protein [Mycobacterium sp. Dal123C01]|uniref:helix-turn-helix domain-containing protein n=1 Tax=Mycobacterium sp. Dal123C01 TaxID=3457577 RepID=UPI00403EA29F